MSLIIILGIVVIFLGFIIYGKIASQKWQKENIGQYTIAETEHFYWHLFYYNADDPRIFVPKQTGVVILSTLQIQPQLLPAY